jgi:tripartite-type tricarboxylate transporter receptor subunit TctC
MIGAWRGVSGPAGLNIAQVRFWEGVIKTATAQSVWREELARLNWSPMLRTGADLHTYFNRERADFVTVLGELGLLKAVLRPEHKRF